MCTAAASLHRAPLSRLSAAGRAVGLHLPQFAQSFRILTPCPGLQGALTALLLAGFGAMWQFDLFRRNNFGLLFFLFFLFQV